MIDRERLHHMLPAPGVYDALITLLLITVSACTTPLKRDMPALTVSVPAEISTTLALTVTLAEALTVTPAVSSLIELPLLSVISTAPGPSLSVMRWPPGGSRINCS